MTSFVDGTVRVSGTSEGCGVTTIHVGTPDVVEDCRAVCGMSARSRNGVLLAADVVEDRLQISRAANEAGCPTLVGTASAVSARLEDLVAGNQVFLAVLTRGGSVRVLLLEESGAQRAGPIELFVGLGGLYQQGAVAVADDGFLLTVTANGSTNPSTVYAQHVGLDGTVEAPVEVRAAETSTGRTTATFDGAGFAVVWAERAPGRANHSDLWTRRLDPRGAPVGDARLLVSTPSSASAPALPPTSSGRAVLAYVVDEATGIATRRIVRTFLLGAPSKDGAPCEGDVDCGSGSCVEAVCGGPTDAPSCANTASSRAEDGGLAALVLGLLLRRRRTPAPRARA